MNIPTNHILHMSIWSALLGALVGAPTVILLLLLTVAATGDYPLIWFISNGFFGLYFGALAGGGGGALIGFVQGLLLKLMLRSVQFPMSSTAETFYRGLTYSTLPILTIIGSLLLMRILAGQLFALMLLPALVATAGTVYIVHLFFRRWLDTGQLIAMQKILDASSATVPSSGRRTEHYPPEDGAPGDTKRTPIRTLGGLLRTNEHDQ